MLDITSSPGSTEQNAGYVEEIVVGNIVQGVKIEVVYASSASFVIFKNVDDPNVNYRCSDSGLSRPIARIEAVMREAERRFKGERKKSVLDSYVVALREVMYGVNDEGLKEVIDTLKVEIERFPEIAHIIGRGKQFSVWQNVDGAIEYRHNDSSLEADQAIAEFTRLQSLAAALLPNENVRDFNRRLGAALHVAFKLKTDGGHGFAALEKMISDTVQMQVRLKLLLITVVSAGILLLLSTSAYFFLALPPFLHICTIGLTGGFAGALISFMERSKDTQVGESDLGWFTVLSSVSRILLGGLFGVIAFAAADADIAFSLFKTSKPAVLILGIVAGFSERFIPDMLATIVSPPEDELGKKR